MILHTLLVSVSTVPKKWDPYELRDARAYAYDNAGNWEYIVIPQPSFPLSSKLGLYLFKEMLLPHNYTGYIGNYFVDATFSTRSS